MTPEMFLKLENILFTAAMVIYLAAMALFFVFFALKQEKSGQLANRLMYAGSFLGLMIFSALRAFLCAVL